MKKDQFKCPAKFVQDGSGYLMPIYPLNPDAETREHISSVAKSVEGMRPNEMTIQQIWHVNAHSRILVDDRLARDASENPAVVAAPTPAPATPTTDEKFRDMMVKIVQPA